MTQTLKQLSNGFASAVETAGASIVRVEGRRRLPATGIIWSADGLIATANHVVQKRDKVKVGLADGTVVDAEVIGRDGSTDLAILKANAADLTPATLANDLKVGHLVLALGRPGRTVQATLGVVSALGDSWRTGAGGEIDRYLQTDVLMYPGFSGGPLVNADGEVVGLNTSALARGVSLTIPNATVQRVAEAILAGGSVKRGYLGVSTQVVRLPEALAEELTQETGLLVAGVEAGSPADTSGILLGDTIITFANQPIRHHDDLLSLLNGAVGQKNPVKIVRGGQVQELNVTVGEKG